MRRPILHPVAQPAETSRAAARMKRRPRVAPALVALALLVPALPAMAQAKRCDLVGRDTTVSGVTMKKCLDLASLRNQTVTVPSNVTRIDNDGLSLCNTSVSTGGNADIVYVYDNSGSMYANHAWIGEVDGLPGNDTLFYHGTGGCPANSLPGQSNTNGTISISVWNAQGTARSTRTGINLLRSNTGCRDNSGDPYNVRGRAYRLGLANQGARAPQSGAGIMSFVGNANAVGNVGSPRIMSAGNVTALQNTINAVSNGGTNYRPPLDTAKRWLTTGATTNPKKAIIFLSDGVPNSITDQSWCDGPGAGNNDVCDYLSLVDGSMPPIYGIFLGRDTVNTGKLRELSQRTNGQFYLIPPTRPDSLIAVVDRILDVVLLEYVPNAATVSNLTLGQSANSSAPAGFTQQPNGSWLMNLSDIVALNGSASNQLRVATQFRESGSGTLQNDTINFTIATTGPAATSNGILTTQFSRVCYDPSSLRILRPDGTRPPALTEADAAYQLRLRTGTVSIAATTADARSRGLGDVEAPSLARTSSNADSSVFSVTPNFQVAATANSSNGTLQASQFDSVFATWTHPRDAQDVARDTMVVRAANRTAQAWFSLTEGGPAITSYEANQTRVFVVISDQQADPRRSYTAVITSERFGSDSETVVLRVLSPGILVADLPVSNATKSRRDGQLQVSVGGDQLKVEYRDPTYGEVAIGTAGFDENVQETASLAFTDENGAVLDPAAVWSPDRGKLYVRYEDDVAYNRVPTKSITLSLASRRYNVTLGVDDERFNVPMAAGSSGTRAAWTGSIDLSDAFPATDSNGRAETRFRGEATVTAFTHDNTGAQQGTVVTDFLVIAYPDSQAVLTWTLADTTKVPAGSEGLVIGVRDQDFTNGNDDSAAVTLICNRSGDSVSGVTAREIASGSYETGITVKDGSVPNLGDRVLSCHSADQIVIRYVDPVYGTSTELTVNEVVKPVATPPGRSFVIQEFVSLATPTPGAIIYYTLDGSTPRAGTALVYTDPIQIIGNTVLKAIAVAPGWKDSKVMVETYSKEAIASRLEILDENGNAIPGGVLTGSATQLRFKLITTQANLPPPSVSAATKVGQDAESVVLPNTAQIGSALEYWQNASLNHDNGGSAGNDTLDSRNTDTLIAVWTNPMNPSDVARDTLIIRPAFRAAQVYFTAVPNGPAITTYPDTQSVVYVTVRAGPRDPNLVYQVTISATELGIDDEVVTLTQVSSGVYLAQVPVSRGAKTPDVAGTLQVSAGADQLTAVYVDPVFNQPFRGNAGFGQDVQEGATLEFVRKDSSLVPPGETWSPDEGKVYLRYSDDWLAGIDSLVHIRTAKLALVNKQHGLPVGTDEEYVTLTLVSNTDTRGVWMGSLELRDRSSGKALNDTLESWFRGEATASIIPHTNKGLIGGAEVTDQLVIAYPNKPADILIRDTSGGPVDRITPRVDILVKDQQHTRSGDNSITVTIACEGSGDRLSGIKLVWDPAQNAYVAVPPIVKGEGTASLNDSVLTCRSTDRITVTYPDPVYGDVRTGDARWSDQKAAKLYFASLKDTSVITSAADGVDNSFFVIVEGLSPTRDKADVIDVTLTTAQGERLVVKAVETGVMTGVFRAQVSYEFTTTKPDAGDGKLTANINQDQRNNRVIVTASASIDGNELKAEIALLSAYSMVARAYMKDENGDGRADKAYFVFDKKLARAPEGLDKVAWNTDDDANRQKATASMLSFLSGDSNVVVADFTKSQFGANLTGIPSGARPQALFPADNLFGGQLALLSDSVGPVPVEAEKRPSNLASYSVSATEKRFFPDTLNVDVSEELMTTTSWSDMARFSKGCAPYSESVPLRLFREPERINGDPLKWRLIIDNSPTAQIPLVGDCLFLETDGRYTDVPGNRPARLGVPIKGNNPQLVIRDFRGFPPVAGVGPGDKGFVLVNNDIKKEGSDGRWTTQTGNGSYELIWIPPVGNECKDAKDMMKCLQDKVPSGYDAKSIPKRDIENQGIALMPVHSLSAVQVIATGRYIARVGIYDNFGVHVRSFVQAFGYWGEEKNPWRATDKGLRSYLVWDMKDKNGQLAGQGVYVWKVHFSFSDKKSEVMYTRTGVMRN